MTLRIR